MTLTSTLNERRCFKLVCGAGNEDSVEVEKLVAVYAKAGANYFDLSARADVVLAAKRGIEHVIPKSKQNEYFLNVSVGISGDPHVRKASINKEICRVCGACKSACLQKAIHTNDVDDCSYSVNPAKCIGCGACEKACPAKAIVFTTKNIPLAEVLPPLIKLGLSSVEFHASTEDEEGAYAQWLEVNKYFDGILSICLDRSRLGDIRLINRLKRFLSIRKEHNTIIQCDGAPMSGSDDTYNTTLQTIATADIVQKANLKAWLLLSGGTNSKTTEAARLFGVHVHGVAIGSFARKIIKPYLEQDNFFENKNAFNEAVKVASVLVSKSLRSL